jgi:hypothetical protein
MNKISKNTAASKNKFGRKYAEASWQLDTNYKRLQVGYCQARKEVRSTIKLGLSIQNDTTSNL